MSTYSFSECKNVILTVHGCLRNQTEEIPCDIKICINPDYVTERLGSLYNSSYCGLNDIRNCCINHVYSRKLDFTENYAVVAFFEKRGTDCFEGAHNSSSSYEPYNEKMNSYFNSIGFNNDEINCCDLEIIQMNEDPINLLMKKFYEFDYN